MGIGSHLQSVKDRMKNLTDKKLEQDKKLVLVLDIDHTLLHTTKNPHAAIAFKKKAISEDIFLITLVGPFALDDMTYFVKLRPGLMEFLHVLSESYFIVLYTKGLRVYAEKILSIIDPDDSLIQQRIVCREDQPDVNDLKTIDTLFPCSEKSVLIVDDRVNIWQNQANVYQCHKFHFWPSEYATTDDPDQVLDEYIQKQNEMLSLGERPLDEKFSVELLALRNEDNVLKTILNVLKSVHILYFNIKPNLSTVVPQDTREILSKLKKNILTGVRIIFSGMYPVDAVPTEQYIWTLAEFFGAVCTENLDSEVTHLVAGKKNTEKVNFAVSMKHVSIVSSAWLFDCVTHFRRVSEKRFSIFEPDCEFHVRPFSKKVVTVKKLLKSFDMESGFKKSKGGLLRNESEKESGFFDPRKDENQNAAAKAGLLWRDKVSNLEVVDIKHRKIDALKELSTEKYKPANLEGKAIIRGEKENAVKLDLKKDSTEGNNIGPEKADKREPKKINVRPSLFAKAEKFEYKSREVLPPKAARMRKSPERSYQNWKDDKREIIRIRNSKTLQLSVEAGKPNSEGTKEIETRKPARERENKTGKQDREWKEISRETNKWSEVKEENKGRKRDVKSQKSRPAIGAAVDIPRAGHERGKVNVGHHGGLLGSIKNRSEKALALDKRESETFEKRQDPVSTDSFKATSGTLKKGITYLTSEKYERGMEALQRLPTVAMDHSFAKNAYDRNLNFDFSYDSERNACKNTPEDDETDSYADFGGKTNLDANQPGIGSYRYPLQGFREGCNYKQSNQNFVSESYVQGQFNFPNHAGDFMDMSTLQNIGRNSCYMPIGRRGFLFPPSEPLMQNTKFMQFPVYNSKPKLYQRGRRMYPFDNSKRDSFSPHLFQNKESYSPLPLNNMSSLQQHLAFPQNYQQSPFEYKNAINPFLFDQASRGAAASYKPGENKSESGAGQKESHDMKMFEAFKQFEGPPDSSAKAKSVLTGSQAEAPENPQKTSEKAQKNGKSGRNKQKTQSDKKPKEAEKKLSKGVFSFEFEDGFSADRRSSESSLVGPFSDRYFFQKKTERNLRAVTENAASQYNDARQPRYANYMFPRATNDKHKKCENSQAASSSGFPAQTPYITTQHETRASLPVVIKDTAKKGLIKKKKKRKKAVEDAFDNLLSEHLGDLDNGCKMFESDIHSNLFNLPEEGEIVIDENKTFDTSA